MEKITTNKEESKMRKGFTMIELIIVIIVIGILAGIALPQYVKMIERGKIAAAKSRLDMVRKAEAIYFAKNSKYVAVLTGGWNVTNDFTDEVPELKNIESSSNDFTYAVVSPTAGNFIVTATRLAGTVNSNGTITLDQTGKIGGNLSNY